MFGLFAILDSIFSYFLIEENASPSSGDSWSDAQREGGGNHFFLASLSSNNFFFVAALFFLSSFFFTPLITSRLFVFLTPAVTAGLRLRMMADTKKKRERERDGKVEKKRNRGRPRERERESNGQVRESMLHVYPSMRSAEPIH